MNPHRFTLYDMLARNAEAFGDRVALVTEGGEARTFAELRRRVDALAGGLAAAGLGPGERVVVLAQNSAAYFELYFAAARQGVVPYPLNWRLSAGEVARSIERAEAKAIAVDAQYQAVLPEALPEVRAQFEGSPPPGWRAFADLYAAEVPPRPDVGADDPFAIISTAAVDVIPRGAVLSHANVLLANLQTMAMMGLGPDDGHLLALPLFHVAALGGALAVMHAGGKNVVMTVFDGARAVELVDAHALTHVADFPPVLATVLDEAAKRGSKLASLRHVNGLDAPDTIERLHRETGADFWTGFGQTETSGWVTAQRARDRLGCAGKPGPLARVRLVDDYDEEVPAGTPGEILVRGPLVFHGYFAQPEVTEHTFRGGWHHTGDVGRLDEEGNLWYVKRKPEKELIKPGGENVYPAEVETVIVELEQVRAACVFGVPNARWGEAVAAVVEAPDGAYAAEAITEHVGRRIARFKRPHHVAFTEALPRDDTGAVDREAVKAEWAPKFTG